MNDKVNIIISTYNQAEYLEQAILSVLNQTYENTEILLINDGSTDNTNDIIYKFIGEHSRLLFTDTNDIGASHSRQHGINRTDGEYIIFLDGDDWIDKYFVEKTISVISQNKNLGFVYVDTIYIRDRIQSPVPSPEYNFYNLVQNNFISYCSLFSRKAYMDCGGYDLNNFGYFEDYELYLNLGRHGWYGKHIAENLFFYRIHEKSSFQSARVKTLSLLYRSYLINKYPEIHPREWIEQAKKELNKFPIDFMKWKPKEQEEYLKNVATTK